MSGDASTAIPWTQPQVDAFMEALEDVDWWWQRYSHASSPLTSADALISLSNAMSSLITWHPHYNPDTGTICLPDSGRSVEQ